MSNPAEGAPAKLSALSPVLSASSFDSNDTLDMTESKPSSTPVGLTEALATTGTVELVDALRSTGVGLDLELPQIIVAGNQSSGKSSVLEAIAGINLPRAAGTCTKLPIELRLKRNVDKPWTCSIALRQETDEHGMALNAISEIAFGPPMTDPSLVEDAIRRAQLALLNPSVNPLEFVTYTLTEPEEPLPLNSKKKLGFSKNVVCVSVEGPNVADLTLIDLPGIIQAVDNAEDAGNIELVNDLVKEHMAKDCLILLVVTMKDDINCQKAVTLAREADPKGERTIGVLTKADTVQGSEIEQWLPIIQNQKATLLHGYHVTRQPNADELRDKITFEDARAKERKFFAETEPWKSLPLALKKRQGSQNLTSYLSRQLVFFIESRLPALIDRLNKSSEEVRKSISQFPAPPTSDPCNEMYDLIGNFTSALGAYVTGMDDCKTLVQANKRIYREFQSRIWATAPKFIPYTKQEQKAKTDCMPVDCDLVEEMVQEESDEPVSKETQGGPVDLDDVRKHIEASITRELPLNVPFAAKSGLIKAAIREWEQLSLEAFAKIRPQVERIIKDLVADYFGRFTGGSLPATVTAIWQSKLSELASSCESHIIWLLALDGLPFTQNEHYFSDVREKMASRLRDQRYPKPTPPSKYNEGWNDKSATTNESNALAALAALGYHGVKADDLKRLRSPDPHEIEIEVMAEVRAYFQIAYKRIIDDVPRAIDHDFVQPLCQTMRQALISELGVTREGGRERCKAFLIEDPNIATERAELYQKRERLAAAMSIIRKFGTQA